MFILKSLLVKSISLLSYSPGHDVKLYASGVRIDN